MNETAKKILNFDSIAAAEALVGKRDEHWGAEEYDIALWLAGLTNQMKKDYLESIGDTYFNITWQDFIEIAKEYGFKCGFCHKFTGTGWSDDECIEEEEIIFFHEEKGLILYAESFDGKFVNSARVYGEVKLNGDKLEEEQWEALSDCSSSSNENGTMAFDVDVREGFRFHLDALSKAFVFSKSWSKVPFLWFLSYMDTEDKNYSYEEINYQKIASCTPEVRKIIFG